MYNTPFYNPQASIDRINTQIAELEKMKQQIPQAPIQPPITQNFQLAPTNREIIRYADSLEEVQKDMVIGDTPYFSKDMSVLWVKNTKGEIKTYELNELVLKDEKDLKIDLLMAQIEQLKKEVNNEHNASIDESVENEESTSTSAVSKSTKKSK